MTITPAEIDFLPDGRIKHRRFDDIYFSSLEEARHVFIRHTALEQAFLRLTSGQVFRICELGFGTGLNFFLTLHLWRRCAPKTARLVFVSVEKHPVQKSDFLRIIRSWSELQKETDAFQKNYPAAIPGVQSFSFDDNVILQLHIEDAETCLENLTTQIDVWFLDGFVPRNNPDMWTNTIYRHMARLSHEATHFATFTAARAVRRGLEGTGFKVEKVDGYGPKRDMLRGTYTKHKRRHANTMNVTIIGAGIAGCALAHALAKRQINVTLFDQHDGPAHGASGNRAGVIYPKLGRSYSPQTQFYLQAFQHTQTLLSGLGDTGFHACGVLALDIDAERRDKHQNLVQTLDLPTDVILYLNQKQAADQAGVPLQAGGLFYPRAGYLDPKAFCQALLNAGAGRITPQFRTSIDQLDFDSPNIIACGLASTRFNPLKNLPLEAVRGQVSFAPQTRCSKHLNCVINHKGHITPAINGVHVMGSSFEREKTLSYILNPKEHRYNLNQLETHCPNIITPLPLPNEMDGWVGYRAATPDRLPLAGGVPDHENLYVLSGLGSHGLTTAPLLADMIAAQILGDPIPLAPDIVKILDPARFSKKTTKKHKYTQISP